MNEAIHRTRELSRGLLPVLSDARGLMSALERLALEVEDLFQVSCRFECEQPVLIHQSDMATHLYHIAQEAVNNALRHGHPQGIVIRLTAGERPFLSVDDDGVGIHGSRHTASGASRDGTVDHGLPGENDRWRAGGPTASGRRDLGLLYLSCEQSGKGGETVTPQYQVVPAVKKAKILLVDDHPIVRQGLAQLINQEPDLTVCAHAEDGGGAHRAIADCRPDLVILDISLNGPDGLSVLKDIRLSDPTLPVLVLSMHDESLYAERALRAGANGYIMKQEATEKVLQAIRRIRGGEIYVSDRIAKRLLRQIVSSPASGKSPMEALTDRELAVFRYIGKGRGTREIADDLHISVKTVESYQAHIKEKLCLKNARELVQHAFQWVTSEDGP